MIAKHAIIVLSGAIMLAWIVRSAEAQPGHAPFDFGKYEIEDYERAIAPAGIAGATIVDPSLIHPSISNHPCIVNGMSTPCVTGAPVFLDRTQSAWEQWGGILGHIGASLTNNTYNDLFPGGTAVAPNGFASDNRPAISAIGGFGIPNPTYNGTVISLVSRNDANAADDVGITSGNQALRVSVRNVSQGEADTSLDRPVLLTIKAQDLWGVSDSRFDAWEAVRADPENFDISIDLTFLADEIPDTFATTPIGGVPVAPYARLGFISAHGNTFDEGPAEVLQSPEALNLSRSDADGDMLPNFTDPDYIDPDNTPGLPGDGVPGVIQRRYRFPATAMVLPQHSLAGLSDNGNRFAANGGSNAYILGFVWNGNWELNESASFIVDNMRFVPKIFTDAADFNFDGLVNETDWEILRSNLNSLTASTFAEGDIGSWPEYCADFVDDSLSPGKVDFKDFVAFDKIWDKLYGENGSPLLGDGGTAVPEPAALVLLLFGACGMGRRWR